MILDSNIVIYYTDPTQTKLQNYLNIHFDTLNVSAITHLEVLGYHKISSQDKIDFANFFKSIKLKRITKPYTTERKKQ